MSTPAREVAFSGSANVVDVLRKVFAELSGGRQLPETANHSDEQLYNGIDHAYRTREGDGLEADVSDSDRDKTFYNLIIGADITMAVTEPANPIVFTVSASREKLAHATDVLTRIAKASGLTLVR